MSDQEQDMQVSYPRAGDKLWKKPEPPPPSQDRLGKPHSVVTLWNSSPDQTHIVIDRRNNGHELRPGDRKRHVEMLDEDIEYFLQQRAHNRVDPFGVPYPPHPVVVEGAKLREEQRPAEPRPAVQQERQQGQQPRR